MLIGSSGGASPDRPCHGACISARASRSTKTIASSCSLRRTGRATRVRKTARPPPWARVSVNAEARRSGQASRFGWRPGPLAASLGRRSPRRAPPPWTPHPWHPPVARCARSIRNPQGGGALCSGPIPSGPTGHRPLGPSGRGDRRRPRAPVAGCAVLRLANQGARQMGQAAALGRRARAAGRLARRSARWRRVERSGFIVARARRSRAR